MQMSMDFHVRVVTTHIYTFTFSTGEVSSSLNNTACSGDNLFAYNFPNDMCINVICISPTSIYNFTL